MQESHAVQVRWIREPSFSVNNESYAFENRLYLKLRVPYAPLSDPKRTYFCWVSMIVDTGALFSVFPFGFYDEFEHQIEFPQPDDIDSASNAINPDSLFSVKAPGATPISCRSGRLRVQFSDVVSYTPSVYLLAHFLPQGAAWTHPVLALGGGAIGSHKFEINANPGEARLQII